MSEVKLNIDALNWQNLLCELFCRPIKWETYTENGVMRLVTVKVHQPTCPVIYEALQDGTQAFKLNNQIFTDEETANKACGCRSTGSATADTVEARAEVRVQTVGDTKAKD